jgi:hypothetical protein
MNWRRGLLLAGINLAIAVPICTIEESFMWRFLRSQSIPTKPSIEQLVAFQEEPSLVLPADPCYMWRTTSAPLLIITAANLPALLVSGWGDRCPPKLPLARLSARVFGEKTRRADLLCLVSFCFLIVAQWVMVGGFPLIQLQKWWWMEPGALITFSVLAGIALAFLPAAESLDHAFPWLALLGWVYLVGCLIWKAGRQAWHTTLGGLRRLTH